MEESSNNPLAERLRDVFIRFGELRYGYQSCSQVLVVNAYGANVAQTGTTTSFDQTDETWWQDAKANGFAVGGFEYDTNANVWGIPISAEVTDEEGTSLGVIKAVFPTGNIVREVVLISRKYETTEIALLTKAGEAIYETGAFRFLSDVSEEAFFENIGTGSGSFMAEKGGREKLFSYARSDGYRTYEGLDWILVMSHDTSEVFGPVAELRNILIGVIGSLLLGVGGLAFALSRSIASPVKRLTQTVQEIANGDLKRRVKVKSGDEIGQLGDAFNDMTTKLEASYARLEEQIEELKELDRLKDNFLNNTTHELKTPLIPIKSQTQLLLAEDYGTLNEGQKKAVQMILRNEAHLENLVNDVVDITKIRSGKLNVLLQDTDPTEIITNTVLDVEELAKEKGVVLTLQPIPELPTFPLDRKLITQVMGNLLSNALKFTPTGGEVIVEVSSRGEPATGGRKTPREVVTSVKDTGIGMSKETLEKLFTPFFQADSDAARKYGGSGLGLSICKGIVEAHGGTIRAESDGEEKGTTIVFTLPAQNKG
ncbi:MAG: sensor histidine kinase [Thiotrichaceae bacterium]